MLSCMKTYTGSCHCGAVAFTVTADIQNAISCNCSHCKRKGVLLAFVPETDFTLIQGAESLSEYRFNTKKIAHLFCKTCGVQPFGKGVSPDGTSTIAINLNCIDEIDPETLTIQKVNGKDA